MGVLPPMHAKSDSDVTSVDAAATSPPRPLYFVQSPSHHDKMSYGNSSPFASPPPPYYHCSPVHHSRESSTSRFSASMMMKSGSRSGRAWRRLYARGDGCRKGDDDMAGEEEEEEEEDKDLLKFYIGCFVVLFVALFTVFSLILWAVSTTYPPQIHVQSMVFHSFDVHSGTDHTLVPTDMMTLNSTVKIFYQNPATFFGVHVSSTPLDLYFEQLKIASGYMKKFYQSRKSKRLIVIAVIGHEIPLYGSIPGIRGQINHRERVKVPLCLSFVVRSRAYVLGRLVKPTFHRKVTCEFVLNGKKLGKPSKFVKPCNYDD